MNLRNQRRISAQIFGVGLKRVWMDTQRLEEIKEAITKVDLISLIRSGAIQKKPQTGHSQGRTRKKKIQKSKGRQKGIGSRKGKSGARLPKKQRWMNTIRQQRALLKRLIEKDMITNVIYRDMYRKTKGGAFRSRRHLKITLEEKNMIKKHDSTPKKKGTKN